MQKILVYGLNEGIGGIETFLYQYCRHMVHDFEFHFVKMKDKVQYEDELKQMGFYFHRITARGENPLQFLKDLDELFSKNDFDVVWMNVVSLSQISLLRTAKKHGVHKRIIHIHNNSHVGNILSKTLHGINKHLISFYATDFWGSSQEALNWAFPNIAKKQSMVIKNALNFSEYEFDSRARDALRKKMNLDDKKVLVSVSRLAPEKNIVKTIDVFKEILRNDKSYRLLILGSGSEETLLRNKISDQGLEEYIFLIGPKSNVGSYLSAADFYISTSFREGFGTSLLEAQINGLPCIIPEGTYPTSAIINDNIFSFDMETKMDDYLESLNNFLLANMGKRMLEHNDNLESFDIQKNLNILKRALNK